MASFSIPAGSEMLLFALLLMFPASSVSQDTAALIVGGYWVGGQSQDGGTPVLNSAELFGCDNADGDSVYVAPHPRHVYLTAGTYVADRDRVYQCGGYGCTDKLCGISNECYTWNPESEWQRASANLTKVRWSHLMPMVVDLNKTDLGRGQLVPMAMGLDLTTEIYDPDTDRWKSYYPLRTNDRFWYSLGCFIQYGGMIYSIRDNVTQLDPNHWEFRDLARSPAAHANAGAGRCAGVAIDGDMGILTRHGYWFNLNTTEWHAKTPPPYQFGQTPTPNAMFSFRGKPTIFGNQVCNSERVCTNTGVVQYDPETDKWVSLGQMLQPRQFHEVIEVPKSFCDRYIKPAPVRKSAALVVGGYSPTTPNGPVLSNVELFGCENSAVSIAVPSFPRRVYLTSGSLMDNHDDQDYVYVCGGYACDGDGAIGLCGLSNECYSWAPGSANWTKWNSLTKLRWAHLMAKVPNLDNPDSNGELVPMVLGLNTDTEIYNPLTDTWSPYRNIDYRNWYSIGCFIQYNGFIYNMRTNLIELNPATWTARDLGAVPVSHANPGKCAGMTINGEMGIMTQFGYWYNLNKRTWRSFAHPPYPATATTAPNAMFSFRGRPTVFGNPECDGAGTGCLNTGVMQYDPETDSWERLGSMLESRSFHEIIEVPAEFCDTFVPVPTTTTTTTTIRTTTTTTRTTTTTTTAPPGTTSGSTTTETTTTTSAGYSVKYCLTLIILSLSMLNFKFL